MPNGWKDIWCTKQTVCSDNGTDEFARFCELKKANGFDVAVGNEKLYFELFYQEWMSFFHKIAELLGEGIGDIKSVYEAGCGSGVNLYMFQNRLQCKTGGCDYSPAMAESARIVTGCEDFRCCSANEISIEPQYDIVMAESVFQYFESHVYAEEVLRKVIKKSRKITYVGEIHNAVYEQELMECRRKSIDNYETKYEGLSKLFFYKEWFHRIASDYGRKVVYMDVKNPEYINAKYLFNCFIF